MDFTIPLAIYRFSGWAITGFAFVIALYALRNRQMWKGKYLFLGLNFCFSAVLELAAAVTAILLVNNLFIDYLFIPTDFTLLMLYLSGAHRSKAVKYGGYLLIVLFILMQVYKATDEAGYTQFNAVGAYANTSIIFFFSLWNLTIMFRKRDLSFQLRQNADLWFTGTIFCMCFLSFTTSVLADVTYAEGSAQAFYQLYIPRNFIYLTLMYGYVKGIRHLG